jgi:Lysyl oxidase/Secretion system C-terminal sorting domain
MKKIFTTFIFAFVSLFGMSQCTGNFVSATVNITTDAWPGEISWSLYNESNQVILSGGPYAAAGTLYTASVCVLPNECLTLSIQDSYGDGINNPGGYSILVDDVQIGSGSVYGDGMTQSFNCPVGSYCSSAMPISTMGTYTATFDNSWYQFTPANTGTYSISTCGLSTCDTRVYIYSACGNNIVTDGPEGTYAYNDEADCGEQAELNTILIANTTYFIRIGDSNNDCAGNIDFSISYLGPPAGCTDMSACNYNPIAEEDDGSCMYYPNPLCSGPDLRIDSLDFVNSLFMMTHQTANCDIVEGCVLGYGTRYVIAFSSKIDNIGEQDYYIGNPSDNPEMFNTQNCHNHTHYNAYGDYRLFDMYGNLIPAGHKNGFCVMDLCGFGQYNCGDMGISAGCYDVYGAGTGCQWIDITDVPDGDYHFVVMINPYHLPDALGRVEQNFLNNATQICIHIEHDDNGVPTYEIITEGCELYVDCEGVPGGAALHDCQGICGGPSLFGDLYTDQNINNDDIISYMNLLAEENIVATTCNDLSGNDVVSIYDAALAVWCDHQAHIHDVNGVVLDQCAFPRNIENPNQVVGLGITEINMEDNYVEIEMLNVNADVLAYQFRLTGLNISSVVSLVNAADYPAFTGYNDYTNDVFAISAVDSVIYRQNTPQPLCRVYFSELTGAEICIDPIVDIVNKNAERTNDFIYDGCLTVGVNEMNTGKGAHVVIQPNPTTGNAFVQVVGEGSAVKTLLVHDGMGRLVQTISVERMNKYFEVDFSSLSNGVYTLTAKDTNGAVTTERFVKL